jgi:hypothetical protein
LIIATHSEVLIDSTSPEQILSFYREPHPLASETDRDQVREALKRVTSLELLLAENAHGILYAEGTTDFDLLHPASLQRFLESEKGPLFAAPALRYLRQQLPPAFFEDPLQPTAFLRAEPASKTLLPELLRLAEVPVSKSDYFLLAQAMRREELPGEVWDKLTSIQEVVAP